MGNITKRKRKDGTLAYKAQVRIRRNGVIVHSETETFSREALANAWIKKRETELAVPGALELAKIPDPTLGEIIGQYLTDMIAKVGRTKGFTLRAIAASELGEKKASTITSQVITEYAQQRIKGGANPATVKNDLTLLGGVFSVAQPAWGYRLSLQSLEDAKAVCFRLGYIRRAKERTRRPTLDELDRLMESFVDDARRRAWVTPMLKIVPFAIFSTRRQEEIIKIRWDDVDEENHRVLVREMKHPRRKATNDVWCKLTDEAWAILMSMPRMDERIFPYTTDAISAQFTRACQWLGIEDLHFHDLRHEGVSRLFEMDWQVHRVAEVSGHQDWNSLRRYTHLNGVGDKYADWKWLPVAIAHEALPARKPAPSKNRGSKSAGVLRKLAA